jgi:hypothetical protein
MKHGGTLISPFVREVGIIPVRFGIVQTERSEPEHARRRAGKGLGHPGRPRTLLILALLAVLYIVAFGLKARLYGGNASALIGFGCRTSSSCWSALNDKSLPQHAVVYRTGGYDGQYFYYLGRELYGGPAATLDSPPFRRARPGLSVMAGPLLATGDVGRVYGIPSTLLGLHLLSVWVFSRLRPEQRWSVWIFAVNPFSVMSFLLCTADGAALSLGVMGALLFRPDKGTPTLAGRGLGSLLLACAMLTKETAIVIAASVGAAHLLDTKESVRERLGLSVLAGATALPMFVWWHHVGFSLGLAAEHGTFPFAGVVSYLPAVDLTRGALALILALSLLAGAALALKPESRAAGLVVLGTAALVSTATAHEYWAAAANIGRLFTPMAAAPAVIRDEAALLADHGDWRRTFSIAWAGALVTLTAIVLLREATRSPLPYFVNSSGAVFSAAP